MAKSGSVEIPQDIIDNIIAAVGKDKRLLKKCTLVSSSFLLPSRKQLFSRITLKNDQTCQGIYQFLVQNPVIQPFVRTIILKDSTSTSYHWGSAFPEWMNGTSLLAILRLPFCCLECFAIQDVWNWNAFSSELNDALWNIINSSSLKTLSLGGVTNIPITFFIHIVHLATLEMHHLSPNDFADENSNLLTSKGMVPIASRTVTVIDRCVWYLRKEDVSLRDPTKSKFLPFICGLRFFQVYIDLGSATVDDFDILSFLMGSLCMSLTSPATLEHLEFNIQFIDDHDSKSHFDPFRFIEDVRDTDVWSHLDSITTHPAGSRLQRVDIYIDCYFPCGDYRENFDENVLLKAVADCLPSLRAKGILFVKNRFGGKIAWSR